MSKGMDRRDFLRLGMAASLAPLASGPAAWAGRLGASASTLSVGYLAGSSTLSSLREAAAALCALETAPGFAASVLEELFPLEVIPAGELPLGDQLLANEPAAVGIHGLYPALPQLHQEGIIGLGLDVLFEAENGAGTFPFFAWSLSLADGPSPSPPTQFVVPIGPTGGLRLRLRVNALPTEVLAEFGISRKQVTPGGPNQPHFTVDGEATLPRLQRGLYLLGLRPDTFGKPVGLPGPGSAVPMSLCALVLRVEGRLEQKSEE